MTFLVIDCGSSSCRVMAVSDAGKILSISRAPFKVTTPEPTFAEVDTDDLWRLVGGLIASEVEKNRNARFDAVGVSAMLGYVFLGAEGRPLMPAMVYSDNRATAESEEIGKRIPAKAFHAVSGRRISPFLLAPKIRWLQKFRPEVFGRLSRIIGLKDEIVRRLTGQIQTDTTHVDYSGLFDIRTGRPYQDLLDVLGISGDLIPAGGSPAALAGKVRAEVGRRLGLPAGTPVISGTSDGTAAMYGAGVLEPGNAVLVSGTTDVLMCASRRAVQDDSCTLNINTGALPHTFLIGGPLGASGGTLALFERMFDTRTDRLAERITRLPPGSNGLLFFPGLTGERCPYWKEHVTGGLLGLNFSHRAEHVLRAIMEGCALRIVRVLDILTRNGLEPRQLTVVGGGAASDVWNQIRCDATGLQTCRPKVTEATCLGTAAFCAAASSPGLTLAEITGRWLNADRRYSPKRANTNAYRQLAKLFDDYIQRNEGIYRGLAPLRGTTR